MAPKKDTKKKVESESEHSDATNSGSGGESPVKPAKKAAKKPANKDAKATKGGSSMQGEIVIERKEDGTLKRPLTCKLLRLFNHLLQRISFTLRRNALTPMPSCLRPCSARSGRL
jgi:hypothetical protein